VSMYMNYTLKTVKTKISISLCKIERFYRSGILYFLWNDEESKKSKAFFQKTIELLHKDKDYPQYDMKSKLLSFILHSSNYLQLIEAM
jgi:hypothetical protein